MSMKFRIELGSETPNVDAFAVWLLEMGHVVTYGGRDQRIRGLADADDERALLRALALDFQTTLNKKGSQP